MRITPLEIKDEENARKLMASLGVSKEGLNILSPKSVYLAFKIEGIKSWEANVIKQHLLSLGTDAAMERAALVKNITTQALIFGSVSQLRKLCQKLEGQPFKLKEISENISFYLDSLQKKEFIFSARGKVLKIKEPLVCGIINVTPDSFSGDGLLSQKRYTIYDIRYRALKRAEAMVKAGAKMIDVGGQSSRPFSKPVKEEEELRRVIPAIKAIRKKFKKIMISVDTYKYKVAKEAVEAGVDIINDITALRASPKIASLVKKYRLGCVLMHMKGTPQTMQINPKYKDVVEEEIDFFKERLKFCQEKGIAKDQIVIDPGIGFGKRLEDNIRIIKELYKFKIFGLPIFLGLSRKSFIGKILNVEVEERLIGTIAASMVSLIKGANILRVHDVEETLSAIKIASKIINN